MANVLRGYKPQKNQVNFRYLRSTDLKTIQRWGYYQWFSLVPLVIPSVIQPTIGATSAY
jgi:hypothetical protein